MVLESIPLKQITKRNTTNPMLALLIIVVAKDFLLSVDIELFRLKKLLNFKFFFEWCFIGHFRPAIYSQIDAWN